MNYIDLHTRAEKNASQTTISSKEGHCSMTVTLASLFDGIGGAPLCAIMCGAVPVWASEIEKFPIAVTKHHFPDMKHYGDICIIDGAKVEPVDIIVGGSPCQDLSVAGKRAGLAGGRSGLFMEQIRIVKEMRAAHGADKPRFMVWENVPGAFSSNNGEDFRAVLEETARIADSTVSIPRSVNGWANAGSILGNDFSISWRTIDAQYWGVAQRRRRIYLVADFGGQSAPEILCEEREGMSGNSSESCDAREATSGYAQGSPRGTGDVSGFSYKVSSKAGTVGFQTEQSPTILSERHDAAVCYKEPQVICLQGNCIDRSDTARCNGKGWCEDVSYTLNTIDRPAVLSIASRQQAQSIGNNLASPIPASDYKEPQVVFDGAQVTSRANRSNPQIGAPCHTLAKDNAAQTIVCLDARGNGEGSVAPRMTSDHNAHISDYTALVMAQGCSTAEICEDMSPTLTAHHEQPLLAKARGSVRRLTPLECERLQGYPDYWCHIPGASDSAIYKAIGNSFAIPCAYFVISGCIAELEKQA
jgi:DNA (cytosine-5)-methyltransferase 1